MNETNIYIVKFKTILNVIYVGNTHLELNKRLRNHKYHTTTLHKYIQNNNIDWNDVYIELYEIFKYNERKEYEDRETKVIEYFLNNENYIVINSSKTGGSPTKQILKDVEYYIISNLKDIIHQNIKDYFNDDINIKKEKAKLCSSINYYKNREFKLKQMEEYRKLHKQDKKKMFDCECGHKGLLKNKIIHFRSKKHQEYIKALA